MQNDLLKNFSQPFRRQETLIFTGIVIGALLIRLVYIITFYSDPISCVVSQWPTFDQFRFLQSAKEFLHVSWLGTEVTRYSPAYSYFIAMIFSFFNENIYWVFLVQTLVGGLSCFLFYKCGALLFEEKTVGLIAAFLAAFYGPFIFYENTLLRASLIAYLNLGGFYFLLLGLKRDYLKYIAFSGILLGLSCVLRPHILIFFVLSYLIFFYTAPIKKRIYAALILSMAFLLPLAPLSLRNNLLGRHTLISYQGPSTFWIGNTYDSSGIGLPRTPMREKLANEAGGDISLTVKILLREIIHHPKAYLALYTRKIYMFFNGYEIPANLSFDLAKENNPPLRLAIINFRLIVPFSLLGIFLCPYPKKFRGLLLLFLAILSASVIMFHIQGRYRLPSVPFFILFASGALYWLMHDIFTSKNQRYKIFVSVFLLGLFILTAPNRYVISAYFSFKIPPDYYLNESQAYASLFDDFDNWLNSQQKKVILKKALYYGIRYLQEIPPSQRPSSANQLLVLRFFLPEKSLVKPLCAQKGLDKKLIGELVSKALLHITNSPKTKENLAFSFKEMDEIHHLLKLPYYF